MNIEQQQELKDLLTEIGKELENKNLIQEQRERLELDRAKISGQLMSIWLPLGITRKILMGTFFLIGLFGFFTQYDWLIWSFLFAGLGSPRLVGEILHTFGRIAGTFSQTR